MKRVENEQKICSLCNMYGSDSSRLAPVRVYNSAGI